MRPSVLVADADELLVAAYRAFLVVEGLQVKWVTNALDCLDSLRRMPPQALVLDAELLWGSWNGIIEIMNQDADVPNVPIVILTARPAALPRSCLGLHVPVTLLKPVAPLSMALVLRGLLESQLAYTGRRTSFSSPSRQPSEGVRCDTAGS